MGQKQKRLFDTVSMFKDITPPELRCSIGACPAVYTVNDDDTIIVIGAEISDDVAAQLSGKIGKGEKAVRLPRDFFTNVHGFHTSTKKRLRTKETSK